MEEQMDNRKIAIFGAGKIGKAAAALYLGQGKEIVCFLDNDKEKWGTSIFGIPVKSLQEYVSEGADCPVMICATEKTRKEILVRITESGIRNILEFNKLELLKQERFVSYSYKDTNEDIILNHVLKNDNDIFWIDIGCNDPYFGSVTQAFYDRGFHGINIDIQPEIMEITKAVRPRDINLLVGVGSTCSKGRYYQMDDIGGLTTMAAENVKQESLKSEKEIDILPLKAICEEHLEKGQEISFLKIDVEGMEEAVLLGADFVKYRPRIVVIEATVPMTTIPVYDKWEHILLENHYHYVYSHGVNRYYAADEWGERYDARFEPFPLLKAKYTVFLADMYYIGG